jgi:hypothetical protein
MSGIFVKIVEICFELLILSRFFEPENDEKY